MKSILKNLIPLQGRIVLKKAGCHLHDIVRPITTARVPPRAQTFIGGGDFESIGNSFFKVLKSYGLTPEMDVLDVGCGQGRMARPMAGWLSGEYHGFDISKDGILWCQREYQDIPNFTFAHANVFNARYNVDGDVAAKDFKFPFGNDRFDMIYLTSVFTHMFQADVENYMDEIARVLKTGGTCLISWYLWDGLPDLPEMDFRHVVNSNSRTTLKENPEAAMAFDMGWVKAKYSALGLDIVDLSRGSWAGGSGVMGLQDLIVAKKT